MNIIFCSFTEQSKSYAKTALSNANEINKRNPIFEIKQIVELSKSNAVTKMVRLISLAKIQDATIVIDTFEPLQRNRRLLKLLRDNKVKFTFLDFPLLDNAKSLKTIIGYLDFTEGLRTGKIKKRIKERKANGGKQGLATLSKKKVKEITKNASRKKQYNIATSSENIELRKYVNELRDIKCQTYSQIAEILNSEGKRTSRGAMFTSKAVERVYKLHYKLVNDNFHRNADLELACGIPMNANTGIIKELKLKGLKNDQNFNTYIEFKFLNKNFEKDTALNIEILDNNKTTIYSNNLKSKDLTEKIIIDLKKTDIVMLPGTHYLQITDNKNVFSGQTFSFSYHKEAIGK